MEFTDLQKALGEGSATWRAKRTPLFELDPKRRRVAGIPEMDVGEALRAASGRILAPRSSRVAAPRSWDWRTRQPPILSPIKDQDACNSCTAFAICAVMEARLCLHGGAAVEVDLSEADLFFCGSGSCERGMPLEVALSRAQKTGVGLEVDFGYDLGATDCVAIPPRAKAVSFDYIVDPKERRLSIAEDGPVVGVMKVYEDFLAYGSGVYEHVAGDYEGLHAVVVVGYDDDGGCWIARNSWGPDAGEEGYFRIRYNQCELDTRPFVAVDVEIVT